MFTRTMMKLIIVPTTILFVFSISLIETDDCAQSTCATRESESCTYYFVSGTEERSDGTLEPVLNFRNKFCDRPMMGNDDDDDDDDDGMMCMANCKKTRNTPFTKRIIGGLQVPASDEIINATFKASFRINETETGYCNVAFVETNFTLVTSAACCYTENFPVGPNLLLDNGWWPQIMVNVYVKLVPGTYVRGGRNDFCLIVLNKAAPNVFPLKFSFESSKFNETLHVFSYGSLTPKGKRMTRRLQTGMVKVLDRDEFGVVKVLGDKTAVCTLDSGGVSRYKGQFHGIVAGNRTRCSLTSTGAICDFQPLETYIRDALVRFPKPPGE